MDRIEEVDRIEEGGSIDKRLKRERRELRNKFEVVFEEEISLRQKSRVKWVKEGDNNTIFP